MAVTEIAILHSSSPDHIENLRQHLKQAQPIQEAWHAKNFPNLPSSGPERGDVMFQQVEDPANILISARWDSVAAHWQWIQGDENQKIMGELGAYIASDNVVLLHLDNPDIFSSPASQGRTSLQDSPVISISRIYVDPQAKDQFSARFEEAKRALEDFVAPHIVRGGWREDKEDESKEEFVVFCGWQSLEKHGEFKAHPTASKYRSILELATGTDMKHYKRFL